MKQNVFRVAVLIGLCWALTEPGHSQTAPAKPRLPNLDRRATLAPKDAIKTPERAVGEAALQEQVPGVQTDFDPFLGTVKSVRANLGFLTGPNGQGVAVSPQSLAAFPADDPSRAIKAFLNEHRDLFGHGAELIANARVTRDFVTAHNGMKTTVWEQQVDGIPVFEALLVGHVTRNGELVNLSSQFLPEREQAANLGVPNRAAVQAALPISARQAVVLAAAVIGETVTLEQVSSEGEVQPGPEQLQRFSAMALPGGADAKLLWVPMNRSVLRLVWDVLLKSRARGELFRVLVDAQTGEVLIRRCLTDYISDASYRVFTSDSPSPFSPGHPVPSTVQPPVVNRVLVVTNAISVLASPNGWINDGDNETRGNNVDAHADRNGDNQPDLPRPQGNPNRVFDFPLDLTMDPTNSASASVVQLFYWNNFIHDKLYELGFTEAAGNFQVDNFGRGGLGNDAVSADGLDGGGFNNANMGTPPDGFPPRMQMYLWNFPTPHRDGDFDAEVVLHEYTHGLSNRRVGQGVLISELQTAGMGEGWSDFYGLSLLSEAGDNVDGNYAFVAYATYQLAGLQENYYFGIRRYPYTTDLTKNPLTFKDIDPSQALPHTGVPRSPISGPFDPRDADEVHNQGEVWCAILWEVRANLVKRYGGVAGNQLTLQLVTDGMNLSPANPNFVQSRDAILQADQVATGGANFGEIWAGFAKRGLGASATSPDSSTTTGVAEAYDLPGLTLKRANTDDSQTGNGNGAIDPNECNKLSIFLGNGGLIPATNIFATLTSTNLEVTITQSRSAYADLPGGGIGAGLVPFELYTSPDLQCGVPLSFVLTVTSSRGTNIFKFRLNTGLAGTAIRFNNDVPLAIPDLSSNSSPVVVSGVTSRLAKVAVSLHLKHTADVDLAIWLEAPDGTRVVLSDRNGGRGDDYGTACSPAGARTTFEDRSPKPVAAGTAPFVGTYRPDEPLVAYVGKSGAAVNGTWRLHVDDLDLLDTGTLECWTLALFPVICTDGGGNCATDLALTVSDAPDPVLVQEVLTYTATVSNGRPNAATNTIFTDLLPVSASFLSASSSQGSCSQTGGKVTCQLGAVNQGNPVTITMRVKPTAAGSMTNGAVVTTSSAELSLGNNGATNVTTVVAPVSVVVAAGATLTYESIDPPTGGIENGETVHLSLALKNTGGKDTGNLTATLLSGDGVASLSDPQVYGVISAGGPAVSQSFTSKVDVVSGDTVQFSLQLNDGSALDSVTFTFHLSGTATFGNTSPIVIPNTVGSASPYPSTLNVTGLHGLISKATVTLVKFSHSFPDDVDILLVSPSGEACVLISDCGGNNSLTNVTFTLDDASVLKLPDTARITAGVFHPTDYETGDSFPSPAPAGNHPAVLAVFNGTDPNGTWSLYVADDSMEDAGVISGSWKLTLSTVDPVNPAADLALTATSSRSILRGDDLIYTATVVNHGPDPASGVVLTNAVPAGVQFVWATSTQGACSMAGGVVTCALGTLGSGASASVTIMVTSLEEGLLSSPFQVSGNELDLHPGDNSATVVSLVEIPFSDLALGVIDSPDPVLLAGDLTYAITVTNLGPNFARAVTLTNTLSPGVIFSSVSNSVGSCAANGQEVTCALGTMTNGARATIWIVVNPNVTGFVTNNVKVASASSDPHSHSDTAVTRTTVNAPLTNVASTNSVPLTIPKVGAASLYPSSITVSGLIGTASKVKVGLVNLSHSFPEDVDILLVSPTGRKILLMSDAGGGNPISHVNLIFDQGSANALPALGQIVSGTFKPSDYEVGDVLPGPAPAGPYEATLANLVGQNPNGIWSLYVADDTGGDEGSLAGGWWLNIQTDQDVADLDLKVTPPPSPILSGGLIAYEITVTNLGPGGATGVVVTNLLPDHLSGFSTDPSRGGCEVVDRQVTCNLGSLPSGTGAKIRISGITSTTGSKLNVTTVRAPQHDPQLANNRVETIANVIPVPSLHGAVAGNGNLFQLTVPGPPGFTFVTEVTTNLFNPSGWHPVDTNTLQGVASFLEYPAVQDYRERFFRVRWLVP